MSLLNDWFLIEVKDPPTNLSLYDVRTQSIVPAIDLANRWLDLYSEIVEYYRPLLDMPVGSKIRLRYVKETFKPKILYPNFKFPSKPIVSCSHVCSRSKISETLQAPKFKRKVFLEGVAKQRVDMTFLIAEFLEAQKLSSFSFISTSSLSDQIDETLHLEELQVLVTQDSMKYLGKDLIIYDSDSWKLNKQFGDVLNLKFQSLTTVVERPICPDVLRSFKGEKYPASHIFGPKKSYQKNRLCITCRRVKNGSKMCDDFGHNFESCPRCLKIRSFYWKYPFKFRRKMVNFYDTSFFFESDVILVIISYVGEWNNLSLVSKQWERRVRQSLNLDSTVADRFCRQTAEYDVLNPDPADDEMVINVLQVPYWYIDKNLSCVSIDEIHFETHKFTTRFLRNFDVLRIDTNNLLLDDYNPYDLRRYLFNFDWSTHFREQCSKKFMFVYFNHFFVDYLETCCILDQGSRLNHLESFVPYKIYNPSWEDLVHDYPNTDLAFIRLYYISKNFGSLDDFMCSSDFMEYFLDWSSPGRRADEE